MKAINQHLRVVSNIEGIRCMGCLNRIHTKLEELGATHVDVDVASKIIKIDYSGTEIDANKYIDAINAIGYTAKKIVVFDPDELNV